MTEHSQCFPLACCDASDGFRHLSPALAAEVLKDDRLAAGEEGEVAVFWAAVSWLEAERSRRRNADEASWVRLRYYYFVYYRRQNTTKNWIALSMSLRLFFFFKLACKMARAWQCTLPTWPALRSFVQPAQVW